MQASVAEARFGVDAARQAADWKGARPPTPLKEQKSAEVIENIEMIFREV
jgi:hypothetical protein